MRALGWIIGLLALLIVAIGVFVVMSSGALLERAIESYGTEYLGAPVEVRDATVSLTEGSAAINGLVIGNPPGFSGPPAFRLNTISMTLNTDELSSELIALDNVTVEGANVAALVQGRESNLQKLMDHLNARIGTDEPAAESEVKLIIDHFTFTNAEASVQSDVLGSRSVAIPDVELTNIGREPGGATIGQVLKQVLEPVVRAVMRRLVEQGVDLEGARERIEQNVRERADEAVGSGLNRLRDTLQPRGNEDPQDTGDQR